MRNVIRTGALSIALMALPFIADAQDYRTIFNTISGLINGLIAILVGFGVIAFFWGLVQYLFKVGEQKSKGLQMMTWGIIGLFVMLSIYGLIHILQNSLGVQNASAVPPPTVTTPLF